MRPIDADELKINLLSNADKFALKNPRFAFMLMIVVDLINIMDTIEAEPVRHGHIVKKKRVIGRVEHHKCPECSHTWQKDKRCKIDEWLCSECGKVLAHNYTNYCPNCGAKMEGGIPDETVHDKK